MKDEITEAKEIKGKILSRIQQQLNQEPGAEGTGYIRDDWHVKGPTYCKSGPCPVEPNSE